MDSVATKVDDCRWIDIRRYSDTRGYLSVIEGNIDIPFEIKRIYYLYQVPDTSRGEHAHKQLNQLMFATSGSVRVTLDDGKRKKSFVLDCPWKGLLVKPGLWRTLDNFSDNSVLMVLASDKYEPDDYIRDYQAFLKFKGL